MSRKAIAAAVFFAAAVTAQDLYADKFVINPAGQADQCLGAEQSNVELKSCLQASGVGEQFALGVCGAGSSSPDDQKFARGALVASQLQPIVCGAPCENSAAGLCGFDIAAVDWCGDTGAGFENTKVVAVPWCDSLAGKGRWEYSAATPCSKQCGRGSQKVAYQCVSNNNFKNACCKTATVPPVRRVCNAQPCSATYADYSIVKSQDNLCLTAFGQTLVRFRACTGQDSQQWIQVPGSSPDQKSWVNKATGTCLTNPVVFGADVKLNFMALQNCQRGLNYQDFAKGQLINTRLATCVTQCNGTAGACAVRDTNDGIVDNCGAGTFTKKLYNNFVTLEKWCDDPASAGQYVVVSRGECNVQCGGGTQKIEYSCRHLTNPAIRACCKGPKPPARGDCNQQPCGANTPTTTSKPSGTGSGSGSGSASQGGGDGNGNGSGSSSGGGSKPSANQGPDTSGMAGSVDQSNVIGTNGTLPGIVSTGSGNKPQIVVPQGAGPEVPGVSNPGVTDNNRPVS